MKKEEERAIIIVRCQDCIHCYHKDPYYFCSVWGGLMTARDGFCHSGETLHIKEFGKE